MARPRKPISSEMGWSTADKIVVRGRDLPSELLGHVSFGDMAYLEVMGRLPDERESQVFNALLVTLVEHGMTPSAMAARLTYLGAPESLQGAVAAGILGVGSVFIGTAEGSASMLSEAISPLTELDEIPAVAEKIVTDARAAGSAIPGIGHPVHKPVDPRAPRLFEIAEENGLRGLYVALMEAVSAEAGRQYNRVLPVNATGAVGALLCELGFDIRVARGLGAMARAVGLVGHIAEELDNPIARELWFRAEDEVVDQKTEHV
ncbi:citryl-CoA lyase [Rhodococcus sp. DMU1]|uniref:citryl-CoA lyase n=1 Tax=Rhodococcus sp. DMU1 TaxID=2722825 RepID=UPI00143ED387|nr:citryl-CoA lyase [Rhodococcus sp. DMU1]QIX53879.1 citryl-CoA lyase [Rhodococcus sp. DMU1]